MTTKVKQESAAPAKAAAALKVDAKAAPAAATEVKAAPKPAAKAAAKPAAPKPVAKVSATSAPKEHEKVVKAEKPQKPKASKVIRDSFTFPEEDYQKISELKKACLGLGINAKKSEILRAGLHALADLDHDKLKELISRIEKIKTGRPLGSDPKKS